MPSQLHQRMVKACKENLPCLAFIDTDLRRRPTSNGESRHQPDLLTLDNKTAIECNTIGKEFVKRLVKYGEHHDNFILCVPIPSSVKEIWVYDIEQDKIVRNFRI